MCIDLLFFSSQNAGSESCFRYFSLENMTDTSVALFFLFSAWGSNSKWLRGKEYHQILRSMMCNGSVLLSAKTGSRPTRECFGQKWCFCPKPYPWSTRLLPLHRRSTIQRLRANLYRSLQKSRQGVNYVPRFLYTV